MISTSVPVVLYALAILLLTVPLLSLIFLWKKYRFPFFRFFISGVAGYFLISSLLIPLVMSMITTFLAPGAAAEEYWTDKHALFLLIYSLLTAVLQSSMLYLVLKYVIKEKMRVYDCMAMGVSYYYYPCMTMALSLVSYARVANAYNKGTLSSLVTDKVTLEALEQYANDMITDGIFIFIAQTINQLFLALTGVVILVLLYHAVKSKKKIFIVYAALTILGYLCVINFVELFFGQVPVFIAILVMIAGAVLFLIAYFRWYRGQQLDLMRQRQEYKERLKTQQ